MYFAPAGHRQNPARLHLADGPVITLYKRLGDATPQVTMSVYADEIEEANDHTIRKARVNALFAATKMAASLAATDGDSLRQTASAQEAEVISLPRVGESSEQAATG